MSEKTLKTRVMNKYDTEENWSKATFTPLKGELIIYAPDDNYSYERFKVGDGVTAINSLDFCGSSVGGSIYAEIIDNILYLRKGV